MDYYCQVEGTYGGGIDWSFGWRITSNQSSAGLLTTWSNAWSAAWTNATTGLDALYPATTEITGFSVAQLDANYKQVQKVATTATLAGTSTDPQQAFQNALLISLRCYPQIGKHARGRTYLPAPVESAVVNNVVTTNATTRVSDAARAVQLAIQADGSTIFVVELPKPKAVPPVPAGPKYVVTKVEAVDKPARQARRVSKVKPNYISAP